MPKQEQACVTAGLSKASKLAGSLGVGTHAPVPQRNVFDHVHVAQIPDMCFQVKFHGFFMYDDSGQSVNREMIILSRMLTSRTFVISGPHSRYTLSRPVSMPSATTDEPSAFL